MFDVTIIYLPVLYLVGEKNHSFSAVVIQQQQKTEKKKKKILYKERKGFPSDQIWFRL